MKKYSNNFSLLSKLSNYYSQTRRKRSILRITGMVKKSVWKLSFQWNEKEKEREKINLAEGVFIVVLEQWGKKTGS